MDTQQQQLIATFRRRADSAILYSTQMVWAQAADELSSLFSSQCDCAASRVVHEKTCASFDGIVGPTGHRGPEGPAGIGPPRATR